MFLLLFFSAVRIFYCKKYSKGICFLRSFFSSFGPFIMYHSRSFLKAVLVLIRKVIGGLNVLEWPDKTCRAYIGLEVAMMFYVGFYLRNIYSIPMPAVRVLVEVLRGGCRPFIEVHSFP